MDSRPPNLLLLLLTCLLHFCTGQSASGQSYTIDTVGLAILPSSTVKSGIPVTLRCHVVVSQVNMPNLTHTFQLTRDDVSVHSITTTEESIIYELSPARAADSGNYECRVTVRDKNRASISQKLDVTGLQTPILSLNKNSTYESEEFTATCTALEEKGSLTFRFYQRFRNGEPERIKQSANSGNSSETTLVLRHVGDSFLYCDYEINLVSGPRRSNRSNEIQVIVKGLHITPVMNVLPSLNVDEGDIMEVVCKVVTPPTGTEVYLKKDKMILMQAPISLSHRFRAQEGFSGELVCKAEWGSVQKETYRVITVKEVFSKPRLTVQPTDIFEGEVFKLICSVSVYVPEKINNKTMQFSIYKDNVKVASSKMYSTVAHPSKNGNYTCKVQVQASSLNHSFEKESQTVAVKAKVHASKPVLSVVGGTLVLGKHFKLLCHSDNGTLPITYILSGPNKLREVREVSQPGERAIFNSPAIYKDLDLNSFICHARNSRHETSTTDPGLLLQSTNVIEPVSTPVLSVLHGTDISEGQDMTLVCSVQRGTLPITFTWYHAETEGPLTTKTSQKREASHKIHNVRGEDRGEYYCVSTNQANNTKQSHVITIGVKLAGWKKGLIAAFCILLILALILVIAFRKHLLRFKRRRTGELSVKSASTKAERLSLTQAEVNDAANVTPGMMGKSVWSEHVSGSESEDQISVTSPEKAEPQYTEVQTRQADPNRAPVKKGTDTVYTEVRNSKQDVPEQADGGSVEYAQLNHDVDHHTDHGIHGDHSAQDDHIDEIDSNVDNCTADPGE